MKRFGIRHSSGKWRVVDRVKDYRPVTSHDTREAAEKQRDKMNLHELAYPGGFNLRRHQ